jgi:hypothetical protein
VRPLVEYGRVVRRTAAQRAVAEAEREVGAAWITELLRLRDATLRRLEADGLLLDLIADELEVIALASDERDRAVRAGMLRVALAREALYRPPRID